jgi:hypothetical protein
MYHVKNILSKMCMTKKNCINKYNLKTFVGMRVKVLSNTTATIRVSLGTPICIQVSLHAHDRAKFRVISSIETASVTNNIAANVRGLICFKASTLI